jgi:dihydrofolate synthase / folylpolyglutamate synthase
MKTYSEVVNYLESLQIMPKTMPGLHKMSKALDLTSWFSNIDPNKVIVVAGTNGKGTTSAALERLLLSAGQKTCFYSSPHLVTTAERIRLNGKQISEEDFVKLFLQCKSLIEENELSHFEALTLMAGQYFFSNEWNTNPDFVIFEVGLGGLYDATNAFKHKYSVITKLGLDHVNILGRTIEEIAINKFGIVSKKNIVVHHQLPEEVMLLKSRYQKESNSNWVEAEKGELTVKKVAGIPTYFISYAELKFEINLPGPRAAENIMTAITLFQILGFDLAPHTSALKSIDWNGRMQRISWPRLKCPLYLSGDHNQQGVESLIELLGDFNYSTLHLIAGIGVDKDAEKMLNLFRQLSRVKLYLTETPFKGIALQDYPQSYSQVAMGQNKNVGELLNSIAEHAVEGDLVLVTGSLYLVGEVLKLAPLK